MSDCCDNWWNKFPTSLAPHAISIKTIWHTLWLNLISEWKYVFPFQKLEDYVRSRKYPISQRVYLFCYMYLEILSNLKLLDDRKTFIEKIYIPFVDATVSDNIFNEHLVAGVKKLLQDFLQWKSDVYNLWTWKIFFNYHSDKFLIGNKPSDLFAINLIDDFVKNTDFSSLGNVLELFWKLEWTNL